MLPYIDINITDNIPLQPSYCKLNCIFCDKLFILGIAGMAYCNCIYHSIRYFMEDGVIDVIEILTGYLYYFYPNEEMIKYNDINGHNYHLQMDFDTFKLLASDPTTFEKKLQLYSTYS